MSILKVESIREPYNNTEAMFIDSSGDVTFSGSVVIPGTISGVDLTSLNTTVSTLATDLTSLNSTVGNIVGLPDAIDVNASAPADSIRIDSSGNLLLGTGGAETYSGPSQFQVIGSSADAWSALIVRSSSTGSGEIWFADNSGTDIGRFDGFISYNQTGRYMSLGTAAEHQMRIDSSGNVGIGTSSPSQMLHLKDHTANNGPIIRLEGDSHDTAGNLLGGIEAYNADPSGDGPNVVSAIKFLTHEDIDHGGQLAFYTHDGTEGGEGSAPVERVRIDSSGNVGIGTTSPSSDLHVSGGADSTIRNTASSGSSWFVGTNASSYILHNESNTPMLFTTNGTERMRIDNSGRVTMPYQPSFMIGSPSADAGNVWTANRIFFNNGSHYNNSTGRFTAPVTGTYFFFHWAMGDSSYTSNLDIYSRKNGARDQIGTAYDGGGTGHSQVGAQYIRYLTAGDYVDCYISTGAVYGSSSDDGRHGAFGGYLIG